MHGLTSAGQTESLVAMASFCDSYDYYNHLSKGMISMYLDHKDRPQPLVLYGNHFFLSISSNTEDRFSCMI